MLKCQVGKPITFSSRLNPHNSNKRIKSYLINLFASASIDLIFDKNGNPRIIEVGARIGATCLPELVLYHKGIDFPRAAVQIACGMKPDLSTKFSQACAAFILESRQDGVMKSYKISEDLKNNPNILEWEVTCKPGENVSCLRKGTDRIGKIVVKGNTSKEALNLARDFSLAFKLDVYKNEKPQ